MLLPTQVVFIALLFLLAKGWTIYRSELRSSSLAKMCGFLFVYFIVYVAVLAYERSEFDPVSLPVTFATEGILPFYPQNTMEESSLRPREALCIMCVCEREIRGD